jgi:hypothetical protein
MTPEDDALVPLERLAAVERHPRYPELLARAPAHAPRRPGSEAVEIAAAAIACAFAAVALGFLCLPTAIVPLILLGAYVHERRRRRALDAADARATWRRPTVAVMDARASVAPSGVAGVADGSAGVTEHFVTLAAADGSRQEYRVAPELADRMRRGDCGVAYLLGGRLLDFSRVSP